jgi:hypothetical protein
VLALGIEEKGLYCMVRIVSIHRQGGPLPVHLQISMADSTKAENVLHES